MVSYGVDYYGALRFGIHNLSWAVTSTGRGLIHSQDTWLPRLAGHPPVGGGTCPRGARSLPKDSLLPVRASLSTATILVFIVMMLVCLVISH